MAVHRESGKTYIYTHQYDYCDIGYESSME